MELDEFHFKIGQTIMYFQFIEHDIKRIYAAMLAGDFYNNLEKVEKFTLGQTIKALKELDFSDKKPYISAEDYNFLKQMTEKRNHWCHQAYQNFMYSDKFLQSNEYIDECRKLERDNERFYNLSNNLEDLRIKCIQDFRKNS